MYSTVACELHCSSIFSTNLLKFILIIIYFGKKLNTKFCHLAKPKIVSLLTGFEPRSFQTTAVFSLYHLSGQILGEIEWRVGWSPYCFLQTVKFFWITSIMLYTSQTGVFTANHLPKACPPSSLIYIWYGDKLFAVRILW